VAIGYRVSSLFGLEWCWSDYTQCRFNVSPVTPLTYDRCVLMATWLLSNRCPHVLTYC